MAMNSEEFRAILSRSGVGIWSLIDAAIKVASSDYGEELRCRRDKIVEALYSPALQICQNCNGNVNEDADGDDQYYPQYVSNNCNSSENIDNNNYDDSSKNKFDDDNNNNNNNNRNSNGDFSKSPFTPESSNQKFSGREEEEDDLDPYGGLFDDELTKILSIKKQLKDPKQTEDSVLAMLQTLADMDITFQALKETDIGRHANGLRKHPSSEVRRLVKQLVRKWKETVDEWVKLNPPQESSNPVADGDSPQQSIPKNQQNGHHQVPDFGYSPNLQNRSSSSERNYAETETKPKPSQSATRRETQSRPLPSVPKPASAPPNRAQREPVVDDERLNSARRRLQENYQEAQNAKKQRTIQVMDIHEIPKPKNGFIAKNKGGFHSRPQR